MYFHIVKVKGMLRLKAFISYSSIGHDVPSLAA